MKNYIGKKVIAHGENSGLFFGTLKEQDGSTVVLANCRKLWYWDGACSIMQIAAEGVKAPQNCKFTVSVQEIQIMDIIEILPCTKKAIKSIQGVPVWKS